MKYGKGGIIANPNCSTIIALMAVTPLHRAAGVKRMVVSTYQVRATAGRSPPPSNTRACVFGLAPGPPDSPVPGTFNSGYSVSPVSFLFRLGSVVCEMWRGQRPKRTTQAGALAASFAWRSSELISHMQILIICTSVFYYHQEILQLQSTRRLSKRQQAPFWVCAVLPLRLRVCSTEGLLVQTGPELLLIQTFLFPEN